MPDKLKTMHTSIKEEAGFDGYGPRENMASPV